MFGHKTALQLTDLPVGVLVVFACSALGVYGIVLSGWASGSTYPLLGGLRSAAQMISYEVAMGLSMVAVFLFSDTMSTSGIVAEPAPPVERHPAVRLVLHLRRRGRGRDQPRAVRPARGRVRTRRRFPHRVLVVQVRDVLPRRVHQHGHRLGAGDDAVPRRMAGAVAVVAVARRQLRVVAVPVVRRQGRAVHLRVRLAARHAAATALRPVHALRLEDPHPDQPRLDHGRHVDPRAEGPRLAVLEGHRRPAWRSCCSSSSCPR